MRVSLFTIFTLLDLGSWTQVEYSKTKTRKFPFQAEKPPKETHSSPTTPFLIIDYANGPFIDHLLAAIALSDNMSEVELQLARL